MNTSDDELDLDTPCGDPWPGDGGPTEADLLRYELAEGAADEIRRNRRRFGHP